MLAVRSRERSERDSLCLVIDRINRQIQDINRVYTLHRVAVLVNGIIENTAVEVLITTPLVVVTLADSYFVRVGVRYRCSCLVTNSKAVNAVATETARVTLLIDSVMVDRLTAPCSSLARN